MRNTKMVMLVGLVVALSLTSHADRVRFCAEVKPLGGLSSSDLDDKGIGVVYGPYAYSEEIDGTGSYYGSLQVGVEIDAEICYVDLLVGGGLFGNGAFGAGFAAGDIGCRFKLTESGSLALGPYLGVIVPGDTEWDVDVSGTDETMELSGSSGLEGGVKMTYDIGMLGVVLQLGYADFSYDLNPDNPYVNWFYTDNGGYTWTSFSAIGNEAEIDMSGFYGQFGATFRF